MVEAPPYYYGQAGLSILVRPYGNENFLLSNSRFSAIYGEKSTVLPSFWGLKDCLPNCKTTIIPGVGHFFPLTRPKLFIAILKPFLEEVDLQRAESARLDQKHRNICNYLK